MSRESWILLGGLALAAVIPLMLGWLLGWPVWVTVPLFVAVLVGIYRKLVYGTRTAADHVGELLDKIGLYPNNPVRDLTARRFADLIQAAGNQGVAHEVRHRFDAPRSFVAPAQASKNFPTATQSAEH